MGKSIVKSKKLVGGVKAKSKAKGRVIYSKTDETRTVTLERIGEKGFKLTTVEKNGGTFTATFKDLPAAVASYASAAQGMKSSR